MSKETDDLRAVMLESLEILKTSSATYSKLLQDSEVRIDRTNEMVSNLCSVVNGLKDAYIHHIDQLILSRQEVMAQNSTLLERLDKVEDSLLKEREHCHALLQTIVEISLKNKGITGTSVNIKQ